MTQPQGRPSLLRVLPVGLFLVIAALFAYGLTGDPQKLPSTLIGKPSPRLVLPALAGLAHNAGSSVPAHAAPVGPVMGLDQASLADGQPVVVNFWASWCAPCVAEHPVLIDLVRQTGVRLVGINHKDSAANARRFLGRYGNPFALVGTDGDGRAGIEWGVYGMPETFVLDGKGLIVYKHVGPITAESLRRDLLPALARARRR